MCSDCEMLKSIPPVESSCVKTALSPFACSRCTPSASEISLLNTVPGEAVSNSASMSKLLLNPVRMFPVDGSFNSA